MHIDANDADDLLGSALTPTTNETADPEAFLSGRMASASYCIMPVPLDELHSWKLEDRLVHASRRFFSVEGLSVHTNFGPIREWRQPIIVQPEIGILGILARRINGKYHFLMQTKMEPGNSSPVQFAATVQATPSNYQRVHGGKPTPYLDYFLDHSRRRVLVDQLLSEHASWYWHKRNRNMIVEIPPREEITVGADYAWLTLGQLRAELARGRAVNMNARTVLSCISYASSADRYVQDEFQSAVIQSHRTDRSDADVSAAMTWLIDQKARYHLDARRVSLREMDEWLCDGEDIRHKDGRYFRIMGLSVGAASREVNRWSQPMLEPVPGNVVAFVCQRRSGVLRFLVQAVVQPGTIDRLELAATIQLVPGACRVSEDLPPLVELLQSPEAWIRLDSVQTEDGGRFYRADTRHVVIEVPEGHQLDVPENYRWMSLGLLNKFIHLGYYVNVEARSVLACLL
jgi:oxidase EvaA